MRTPKRYVCNALLVVCSTLLGVVPFELYFRGRVPIQPPMTRSDPHTDYRNAANLRVSASAPGDFDVQYHTNSWGFRGRRDPLIPKPNVVRRVLAVGDSFTFGIGVNDAEAFPSVLEKILSASVVEVINAGVLGWGTSNELAFLEAEAESLDPDVVVLGVYENDIADSLGSSLYRIGKDGELEKRQSVVSEYQSSPLRKLSRILPGYHFLASHSALLGWLRTQSTQWIARRAALGNAVHAGQAATVAPVIESRETTLVPRLFLAIREWARSRPLIVLLIPSRATLSGTANAEESRAWMTMQDVCHFHALDCIDMRELLGASGRAIDELYFKQDPHWTPLAHRLAAESIAKKIRQLTDL